MTERPGGLEGSSDPRSWVLITDCDHPDIERAIFGAAGFGRSEQVIITPHIAFYSEESLAELNRRAAQNIIEALVRRGVLRQYLS